MFNKLNANKYKYNNLYCVSLPPIKNVTYYEEEYYEEEIDIYEDEDDDEDDNDP